MNDLAKHAPSGNSTTNGQPLECAWCNKEQGKPQGEGSHGICARHEADWDRQLAEYKARKIGARV